MTWEPLKTEDGRRLWDCAHEQTSVRMRFDKIGRKSFCQQCSTCGKAVVILKKENWPAEAPMFDPELTPAWWKREGERARGLREKRSATASKEWWDLYNTYLNSMEWRMRREAVMRRDSNRCQACLKAAATEVHHKTYDHLGEEPLFDLVAVCNPCHEIITKRDRFLRGKPT